MTLASLPELVALDSSVDGVRIPPDLTVPLTPRVRLLLDTPEMRRLARVSQLGLVSLVYPGATHDRLEHSLGVYRLALEFLRRLRQDERFAAAIDESDASALIAAALLHDVGHWAFCHPLEDMALPEIPRHESLVASLLAGGEAGGVLREAWSLDPARVASLIDGTADDRAGRLLRSLLSGPVDVDKMDYLVRDSLHAGVPYGRHFDQPRLLGSLCTDDSGTTLAISDKGRTAAELMVFARYVMFSEVYWHHAVRSATAMLQRAVWVVRDRIEPCGSCSATTAASSAGSPRPPPARRPSRSWPVSSDRCVASSSGPPRSTPFAIPRSIVRSPGGPTPRPLRSPTGSPRGSPIGSTRQSHPTTSWWTRHPRNARWSSDCA